MNSSQRADLSTLWNGTIHWDADMADYCTFRAGGKVDALLVASTRKELAELIQWLWENKVNWRVIGKGSNILVQSKGYDGVVIILGDGFSSVEFVDDPGSMEQKRRLRAGAGCSITGLVSWCCRHEISGVEFLVGIPGSVGGAIRMNAGAWGKELGPVVESVSYIDRQGGKHVAVQEEFEFSYRQLTLKKRSLNETIIVDAVLCLQSGRERDIIAQCRKYLESRKEKQPLGVASAGSFFKNPAGDSAGRLIEDAGLKGVRRGSAMVSSKHANFIVNTGGATADDIIGLMTEVQEKVYLHSGIRLEPEVQIL